MSKKRSSNKQIAKWQSLETKETMVKEVMNLTSLLTGTPNLSLLKTGQKTLQNVLYAKVKEDWKKWAKTELDKFNLDLLYEEPLQVDLINKEAQTAYFEGRFHLDFQYSASELDLLSENLNKMNAHFDIYLNKKFLKWFYKSYFSAVNNREFSQIEDLEQRLESVMAQSFKKKSHYFSQKMWTSEVAKISTKELIRQMKLYEGKDFSLNHSKDKDLIAIRVNLKFGLFALKYFKDKFEMNKLSEQVSSN